MDLEAPIPCSSCGRKQPRGEMFGLEPDLLCRACRDGLSRRMHVRFRPLQRDRPPIVTFTVVGIAAGLYLFDHWIFGRGGPEGPGGPAWWQALWHGLHIGEPVWAGEVHRLLTAVFFHGFFLHILFNAWWVVTLGRAVESGFGHTRFLLLFVGSAMTASAAEWIMHGSGEGLSGVVYGLATFLFVHSKTNPVAASVMDRRTLNFLLMWFVLCIVLTEVGTWNVANWAHGGGAVWGYVVGKASLHARRRVLLPLVAVGTALVIFLSVHVAFGTASLVETRNNGTKREFEMPRSEWRTRWLQQTRRG